MATQLDREHLESFKGEFQRVRGEISKVIVGYSNIIDDVLMAILARGHVLLEGVPGLGKTKLVQTLCDALHLKSSRIQFTPDLMPADILGTNVVRESETGEKYLDFQPGPIFANVILADEINRATPKTQSALLEAMQEKDGHCRSKDLQARPTVRRAGDAEPTGTGSDVCSCPKPNSTVSF